MLNQYWAAVLNPTRGVSTAQSHSTQEGPTTEYLPEVCLINSSNYIDNREKINYKSFE